jgi:hypothetical protein
VEALTRSGKSCKVRPLAGLASTESDEQSGDLRSSHGGAEAREMVGEVTTRIFSTYAGLGAARGGSRPSLGSTRRMPDRLYSAAGAFGLRASWERFRAEGVR